MSQLLLNSQANSALQNTLLNTESLRIPAEYSTKIIDYPHAVNYTKISADVNNITNNSEITIPILKYGIDTQILLCYTKEITPTAGNTGTAKVQAGDIFRVINKVELMSSSRVISTMTSEGLQAQVSSLSQSQLIPVYRNALAEREYVANQAGTATPSPHFKYALPLRFGLFAQEGIMNLSFLENCSIRVTFGKVDYVNTGTAPTIKDLNLRVRYQVYPEEAMAQILASNFSENDLNVLSSRQYRENAVQQLYSVNPDGGGVAPFTRLQKVTVPIKNVDVVSKFYIMVRRVGTANNSGTVLPANSSGSGINMSNPLPIVSIKLLASGQEIIALDQNEIQYAILEENGLSTGNSGTANNVGSTGCGMENIICLPMGLYTNDMVVSNSISLRELNNCQIEVEFFGQAADGTGTADNTASKFQVDIVESCLAIYNISSSTGRLALSLSN